VLPTGITVLDNLLASVQICTVGNLTPELCVPAGVALPPSYLALNLPLCSTQQQDLKTILDLYGIEVTGGLAQISAVISDVLGRFMPVLRYQVGANKGVNGQESLETMLLLKPQFDARYTSQQQITFVWKDAKDAVLYRLDIRDASHRIYSAVVKKEVTSYTAPTFLKEYANLSLRSRIQALDNHGMVIAESPWQPFSISTENQ
jgi:hypothetical protein